MTPVSEAVERVRKLQGRLAYSGALAKHYTGNTPEHTGQRALCEASARDADAVETILADHARLTEQVRVSREVAHELIPAVEAYLMTGDVMTKGIKRQTWGPVLKRARETLSRAGAEQ